jgi:hypothetical protein
MTLVRRAVFPPERALNYSVVGVYETLELAEEAVRILDAARFPIRQITLISRNPEGPGLLLTGALALLLLGHVEEVLFRSGAAGWLRQLMSWGLSPEAIHRYERKVRAGRTVLIAHGTGLQTTRAYLFLTGKDALELHIHPRSQAEAEAAILRG